MTNSFYFPHDNNAQYDPKCSALVNDFGMRGYGIYWMIIEVLHEQGGKLKKFPKLIDGLAFQFKIEKEKLAKIIKAMIHDYELLREDETFIWSDRVLRNLEEREAKRLAKAGAGRLGGLQSGITRRRQTKQNEAVLQANEANEAKERKGKEIKGKKEKDKKKKFGIYSNVLLSAEELKTLQENFSTTWKEKIANMDEGIEMKGYKYKSHYLAILNWARKEKDSSRPRISEEQKKLEAERAAGANMTPKQEENAKRVRKMIADKFKKAAAGNFSFPE